MRTTVTIDDELLARAQEDTGIMDKSALVRQGLKALTRRAAIERLIALGGTMPDLEDIPRRRQDPE
jgi:Arc/MetJ family transcription regulator